MAKTEYKATHHAVQRGAERVGIKGEGEALINNVTNWLNQVIPQSDYAGLDGNGNLHYNYKEFRIISTSANLVITISFHDGNTQTLNDEIQDGIRKSLLKALKPLNKRIREKNIEYHEANIRKFKSYNPKSIETIEKEIEGLSNDIDYYGRQANNVHRLAERYSVSLNEK